MQALLHGVREYLTPVLSRPAPDRGMLTPEEFVVAGEYLRRMAPTWVWSAGEPGRARPYLPPDRQFLATPRTPCRRRVAAFERGLGTATERIVSGDGGGDGGGGADAWVEPILAPESDSGAGGAGAAAAGGDAHGEYADMSLAAAPRPAEVAPAPMPPPPPPPPPAPAPAVAAGAAAGATAVPAAAPEEEEEYSNLADFVDKSLLVVDAGATPPAPASARAPAPTAGAAAASPGAAALVRTRTYDVTVTYDNYYRTPRVYLKGYDEDGAPLAPEAMLEDVMQDYANRTATIETHPFLPSTGPWISIHPCRHALVMKRIVDDMTAGGNPPPPVEGYLIIFMKFLTSMIPTIEYDNTLPFSKGERGAKLPA